MSQQHKDVGHRRQNQVVVKATPAAPLKVIQAQIVFVALKILLDVKAAPATDFFRVFDQALDLTRKNQFDAALSEWKKAVELNPEEARAHFNLALALKRKGQIEEAIVQYQKTVEIDPENTPAYINVAVALVRTGRLDAAIECLEKCLAVSPNNPKAQNNLAAALIEQGRFEEAFEHCERAVEIDPGYADARTNLAIVLARSGKDELKVQWDPQPGFCRETQDAPQSVALIQESSGGRL